MAKGIKITFLVGLVLAAALAVFVFVSSESLYKNPSGGGTLVFADFNK